MSEPEEEADGYRGTAEVSVAGQPTVTTSVELAGNFEPISGRYVWHGRIRSLTELLGRGADLSVGTEVFLTTPTGTANARITAVDLWGSHMIEGAGAPPYEWI